MSMRGNDDERLDALFRAYRDAWPETDASPNFMPNLWARIEARQTFLFSFRRMANAFVTAAVALSIALGVYMTIPHTISHTAQASSPETYVEALAAAHPLDNPDIVAPSVRLDLNAR